MRSRTTGYFIFFAFAVIGIVVLIAFKSVAVEAVYPVESAKRTFANRVCTRISGMFRGSVACAENVRLRREVAALSMLRVDIERLEAENARLRSVLDYAGRNHEDWIAAGVLSFDGGAAGVRRSLRVDKGSMAGIVEGAVVAVPEGLVGRVCSVTPHSSEVALLTDDRLKVSCEIETSSRPHPCGIISGEGEDVLVLRHLTETGDIPPRLRVLTSGRGGVFPRGIEVGTFLGVRKDAKGLACEGEVLPSVEFSTLEDVFIRRVK